MKMQRDEIYACENCPVLLEVLNPCDCTDTMKCGDAEIKKLEAKTADSSTEKHVPVIEKIDGGYKVKVGSVPHPMEEKHWIQMIELHAGNKLLRQYLQPGDAPEAIFQIDTDGPVTAREHCNVHGLWKS